MIGAYIGLGLVAAGFIVFPWIRVSGLKSELRELDGELSEMTADKDNEKSLKETARKERDNSREQVAAINTDLKESYENNERLTKVLADAGVDPGIAWDAIVRREDTNG